jgi:hypothetical protein
VWSVLLLFADRSVFVLVQKLLAQTEQLLQEGVLTEDTLLDRVNKVSGSTQSITD